MAQDILGTSFLTALKASLGATRILSFLSLYSCLFKMLYSEISTTQSDLFLSCSLDLALN